MRQSVPAGLLIPGALVLVVAVALPAIALGWSAAQGTPSSAAAWGAIEPTWVVTMRTLAWVIAVGAASALVGWLPGRALARSPRILQALTLIGLLVPAYAADYARWSMVPPGSALADWAAREGVTALLREGLLFSSLVLWAWPIPAWAVALLHRDATADLLHVDGAGRTARLAAAWRTDRAALLLGGCAAALCLLGDTTAFDVAQVRTLPFELRSLEAAGAPASSLLGRAWPLLGVALLGAIILAARTRQVEPSRPGPRSRIGEAVAWLLVAASLLPLAVLAARLAGSGLLSEFRVLHALGAGWALGRAALAGALAVPIALLALALGLAGRRGALAALVALLLLVAAAPSILVALAEEALWNRGGFARTLYDSPLVVALAHAARFGAVAAVAGVAASLRRDSGELDRSDVRDTRGMLVAHRPRVLAASALALLVVGALAAGEVSIASRLEPPGAPVLASTLLNAIHYQDASGVLLALPALAVVSAAGAWLLSGALRRLLLSLALLVLVAGCSQAGTEEERGVPASHAFGAAGRVLGRFDYPRALDIDPRDGSIVVIDKAAHVQRFDPTGKPIVSWSMPDSADGKPTGVTVGPDGDIWVADTHYHRVMRFSPEGVEKARFGSYGTDAGQFIYPTDIAFLPDGTLLVSEYGGNDRIQRFTPEGECLGQFGSPGREPGGFVRPQSMALSRDGRELFVTDACNHEVDVFGLDGTLLRTLGGIGRGAGQLAFPYGITLLPDGSLLVAEFGNNRIQRLDAADGRSLGIWGSGSAETGGLVAPWAVACSGSRICVLDSGHARVLCIDPIPAAFGGGAPLR